MWRPILCSTGRTPRLMQSTFTDHVMPDHVIIMWYMNHVIHITRFDHVIHDHVLCIRVIEYYVIHVTATQLYNITWYIITWVIQYHVIYDHMVNKRNIKITSYTITWLTTGWNTLQNHVIDHVMYKPRVYLIAFTSMTESHKHHHNRRDSLFHLQPSFRYRFYSCIFHLIVFLSSDNHTSLFPVQRTLDKLTILNTKPKPSSLSPISTQAKTNLYKVATNIVKLLIRWTLASSPRIIYAFIQRSTIHIVAQFTSSMFILFFIQIFILLSPQQPAILTQPSFHACL